VLDVVGLRAEPVRGAGCCGAIKGHLGDVASAQDQARRNIDAWWPYIQCDTPVETILINASGCGAWAKDYDKLLAKDAAYAEKARRVVQLIKDPAELLPAWLPALRNVLHPQKGSLGRVTFQPPCSLSHAMALSHAAKPGPIETGLRDLGFDVRLASVDSHQCCGAGGAYSLLQPELASQLKAVKVDALMATSPEVVVSANIGCIAHLQADLPVPVRHWIEVVDEALQGASPPAAA
jgi:glycolate oxidase iron-sulfur subunit